MSSDWKEKTKRRHLILSASQFETWELCKRKWWLEKIRRLNVIQKSSFTFGTVLHAVIERWMQADERGYGKDGKPVDLYPEGWIYDGGEAVYGDDYANIKDLVATHPDMTDDVINAVLPKMKKALVSTEEEKRIVEDWLAEYGLDRLDEPTKDTDKDDKRLYKQVQSLRKVMDDGACITPDEQAIIQRLIEAAEENGTLVRLPGRRTEEEFRRSILISEEGTNVEILGYIDVSYDDRVEDHKSTKSMRWAKTEKSLRENTQVLIYAKQKLLDAEEQGREIPEEILVRHNIFCKDPHNLQVKHVEVVLTREEIDTKWAELLEHAQEMSFVRDSVEAYHEIPEPLNTSNSCNAYGGCPFLSICSGKESVEGYTKRVDFAISMSNMADRPTQVTVKGNTMSSAFASKLAAKKAANAGTKPPAEPAEQPEEPAPQQAEQPKQEAPVEKPAAQPTGEAPPWCNPECKACKDTPGFNSKGLPCRICDALASKNSRPPSSSFDIETVDGKQVWTEKGTGDTGTSSTKSSEAEITQSQASSPAPEKAQPKNDPDPVDEDTDSDTDTDGQSAAEAVLDNRGTGGRPKKGFILCVNTTPVFGGQRKGSGRHILRLEPIFEDLKKELAAACGRNSFYDIDVWDRRAKLAEAAPVLAEQFGTDIVTVMGYGGKNDLQALVDALRPHAGMEIIPAL